MSSIRHNFLFALLALLTTLSMTTARPLSQLIRRQLLANAINVAAKDSTHAAPLTGLAAIQGSNGGNTFLKGTLDSKGRAVADSVVPTPGWWRTTYQVA